ncbi:sterol desaturase family protein [Janibacter sp. GXQ6167]|uniref:sterol desaturase family protein n=1 Tax=Janibacter sp. GXQ6167 TaxID=3240791 RepID=UPI0035265C82
MARPDLTVLAIPGFVGAMAAEYAWQRRNPVAEGEERAGDYELHDTIASLAMGVGSLVVPLVTTPLLRKITPVSGRWGKALVTAGVIAAVATTAADVWQRRRANGGLLDAGTLPNDPQSDDDDEQPGALTGSSSAQPVLVRSRIDALGQLSGRTAVAAVGSAALAAATLWTTQTSATRLARWSPFDLGSGKAALAIAILGWDAIYYWNHRLSHESRWLWAVHVVHHSSERYNLSTALRQPVAEGFTMAVPYGLLALVGVRPRLIEDARALNLIYQFWIHTEAIRSIGPLERILNTPSHHRAHHGSQRQYLDINHGSILIIWDKLFGTFEPERERVVYGLTRNIDTFNVGTIATHEWRDMARDIANSQTWRDRFGFVLRGPGWAYRRREELLASGQVADPAEGINAGRS